MVKEPLKLTKDMEVKTEQSEMPFWFNLAVGFVV
jgi:hypothetical protein